jgi:hypothetical protein
MGPILLAAGISNSKNEGALAVLGADRFSGSSPEEPGSEYECNNCSPGRPLRYFTFPRLELNRVTNSPYNTAVVEVLPDRIVVYTAEGEPAYTGMPQPVHAIYEFALDLQLRRTYFSDQYWALHRELEQSGRITHDREHCPDRDGPRLVNSWDPQHGWRQLGLTATGGGQKRVWN